jgi:5-hydroxyisourate hydrolase-like protein (transthyretin family)
MEISPEIQKKLKEIMDLVDYENDGRVEIYNLKKELIATGKSKSEIEDYLEENVKPPKTNKQLIYVNYRIKRKWSKNNNKPFLVSVVFFTITPKLEMTLAKGDNGKVIHWTTEDLLKYGFKRSYLSKIIKAIQKGKISLSPLSTESISTILNL